MFDLSRTLWGSLDRTNFKCSIVPSLKVHSCSSVTFYKSTLSRDHSEFIESFIADELDFLSSQSSDNAMETVIAVELSSGIASTIVDVWPSSRGAGLRSLHLLLWLRITLTSGSELWLTVFQNYSFGASMYLTGQIIMLGTTDQALQTYPFWELILRGHSQLLRRVCNNVRHVNTKI